jgi:hypothetical protein
MRIMGGSPSEGVQYTGSGVMRELRHLPTTFGVPESN